MKFELSRFGLQHIMAISGFHFSLIAAFLYTALNFVFSRKVAGCLLFIAVSLYFLFLGYSPSILRAWTVITLVQIGMILERRPLALNSLGAALLMNVLIDPLACLQLGFQFSFVTTAMILLFFTCSDAFLQMIFRKRPLYELSRMDRFHQHGYIILAFSRQALALSLAVNLSVVPLSLYYFHKFSWMGILYNLFFPFLVTISMVLLILALSMSFIPLLGDMIHAINSTFTRFLLNFTSHAPPSLDFFWRTSSISCEVIIIYLSLIIFTGFLIKFLFEKHHPENDFTFL